jgi:hypothetical protein
LSRRQRYTRNLGRAKKAPLPVRTTETWIRFEHALESDGFFSYLDEAREGLSVAEREELDALFRWFCENLDTPRRFDLERYWFCAEAVEHVSRARRMIALLREAGVPIVERRTRRIPGKVRYRDGDQVGVLTYRDTPKPKR